MTEEIVIRDIESIADVHAAEKLQKEVWAVPDLEVVPLSQLVAARHSGGVLLGAFDRDVLVGFAYGFVGIEAGETVHHSHMLAVRSDYRSHDLGYRLKLAQRDKVLTQGISTMTWTFDPLQSLNGYFNIGKLGATSNQYLVNFYGEDASSILHRSGTDRLWVTWPLTSERVAKRLERTNAIPAPINLHALVAIGENGIPISDGHERALTQNRAIIEIPTDINTIHQHNPELGAAWRSATRSAFSDAIARGFVVEEFLRFDSPNRPCGMYVLGRQLRNEK